MNKTIASTLVIAFAALAGGQAMAAHIDPTTGFNLDALQQSMRAPAVASRAQVRSDYVAARATQKNLHVDPVTGINLSALDTQMHQRTSVSRDQVKTEFLTFRSNHKMDVIEPISGVNLTALEAFMNARKS